MIMEREDVHAKRKTSQTRTQPKNGSRRVTLKRGGRGNKKQGLYSHTRTHHFDTLDNSRLHCQQLQRLGCGTYRRLLQEAQRREYVVYCHFPACAPLGYTTPAHDELAFSVGLLLELLFLLPSHLVRTFEET